MEIDLATVDQKPIIDELLQRCLQELSVFGDVGDVDANGRYEYRYLDLYWQESARYPFIIRTENNVAGLSLVRTGDPHEIAEFYVLPEYRRRGIARDAARRVFAMFPGQWLVHEMTGNAPAAAFWRSAIPYEFEESEDEGGITQTFVVPA